MKPAKQFIAVVEQQHPAQNECAILRVVGHASGTYEQVWSQAKNMTAYPVITFKEQNREVLH